MVAYKFIGRDAVLSEDTFYALTNYFAIVGAYYPKGHSESFRKDPGSLLGAMNKKQTTADSNIAYRPGVPSIR